MIAHLRNEAGAEVIEDVLLNRSNRCYAHAPNVCEVYYDFHRAGGEQEAEQAAVRLAGMGIRIVESMSGDFWRAAAKIKATQKRVSLADCFAIALAQRLGASILTTDHHEFDSVAQAQLCAVTFIR